MKILYSLLLCLGCVFALGAQEPTVCCQAPQTYELVDVYNTVRLNTVTGEIWIIEWALQSEKTKVEKFQGGPVVDAADSYPGRFSIFRSRREGHHTYFLVDHKTGSVWQPIKFGGKELQLVLPGE